VQGVDYLFCLWFARAFVLFDESALDSLRLPVVLVFAFGVGAVETGDIEGFASLSGGGTKAGAMAGVLMGELVEAGLDSSFTG
jgi:hypothetical protein